MYPWAQIGPFTVQWYYIFMLTGMVCGVALATRLSARAGLRPLIFFLSALLACFVGYNGTRLLYVITRLGNLEWTVDGFWAMWRKGMVWYGGIIFALPVVLIFLRLFRQPLWRALDCYAPGIALGQMFGRIGCFCAGCCYGKPTDSPLGLIIPNTLREEYRTIPIHPAQLYEAFGLALVCYILLVAFRKRTFDGQIFLLYLLLYPVLRFGLEFFRDDRRGFVIEGLLTTSQFISSILFSAALVLFFRLRRANAVTPG